MSPVKDRALQAAVDRLARIHRLQGNYNHLGTLELHNTTQTFALREVYQHSACGLSSIRITNALNAVSTAILSN